MDAEKAAEVIEAGRIKFRNDGTEVLEGWKNGPRVDMDDGTYYEPVWVPEKKNTLYVHSNNILS